VGTEHYLPWYSEYMSNLIIAKVKTLSHDDSYTLTTFLQMVIILGGMAPWLPPLDLPLYSVDVYVKLLLFYISMRAT